MLSKTDLIIQELQKLFRGEYDPWEFSCTFPDVVYNNYDDLEKEHRGLGYYLDQVVPDICDEGEPGFDPTHMIGELKQVYEKVKAFCN